jgi:hypothetical protein
VRPRRCSTQVSEHLDWGGNGSATGRTPIAITREASASGRAAAAMASSLSWVRRRPRLRQNRRQGQGPSGRRLAPATSSIRLLAGAEEAASRISTKTSGSAAAGQACQRPFSNSPGYPCNVNQDGCPHGHDRSPRSRESGPKRNGFPHSQPLQLIAGPSRVGSGRDCRFGRVMGGTKSEHKGGTPCVRS